MRTYSTLAALSLLAVDALTLAYAGRPSFAARTELPFGSVVTTGDYNGDGIQDLIAAVADSSGNYQISIQISNGKGGFTQGPVIELSPGVIPTALATADFNCDGKLDIAILAPSEFEASSTLYLAIQHSSGFVLTSIVLPESISNTANIAIGDLNGDKLPDIVIPTDSGTTFLLNAGGGKFETPEFANTAESTYVVVADLNGDHKEDLVIGLGCCSASLAVLLGDGRGGFHASSSQPIINASKFAVADLNGDGKLDIVAIEYGLEFSLGNGDGTFGAPELVSLPGPFTSPTGIAAADLNGDGSADLAVIAYASNTYSNTALVVFLNGGKAVFNASSTYSVGTAIDNIILAPFTSAKAVDAFLMPNTPSLDALLLNNGKGLFGDGITFDTPQSPAYMVAGDFNEDGRVDLAASTSGGLTLFLNSGNTSILKALPPLPFFNGPLAVGDFNGDGRLDLVEVNTFNNYTSAQVLLGAGGGEFFEKPPSVSLGYETLGIGAADMNGDGKLDLVTSDSTIILGNGDGTFRSPNLDPSTSCVDSTFDAVVLADFNRDGKPDLLSMCNGSVYLYLNNGSGTLGAPSFEVYGGYPGIQGVAEGDFNRDGIPDFAYTVSLYAPNSTLSDVYIEIGNGDGTFRSGQVIQVPGNLSALVAADLNADGRLDLAAIDVNDAAVIVLSGKGDGTFEHPLLFGTSTAPACLLAVPLHDPAQTEFPDLVTCAGPGISIDYNSSK